MKLLVTAPVFWPTLEDAEKKVWLYLVSCDKAGVPIGKHRVYGVGATNFPGQLNMRVAALVDFLQLYQDYSHVLFTDAWDVLFVRPLDEIISQYRVLGSPPWLSAGTMNCGNIKGGLDGFYDESAVYRYPSSAMFIAEIPLVIERYSRMDMSNTHDESYALHQAWCEGWHRPEIDKGCRIFQSLDQSEHVEIQHQSIYNNVTDSWPGILHFGGGYVDPETGKDAQMLPWAKQLGIIP